MNRFKCYCQQSRCARLVIASLLLLYVLPGLSSQAADDQTDAVLLHENHPLVGKIWQVGTGTYLSDRQYVEQLLTADTLMVGELHNNPAHHRHQARVIRELAKAGRNAAVAYEMISLEQGDRLKANVITSVDQLIGILDQDPGGWDYENQYRVVFAATLAAGYPFIATNLDRKSLMSALMDGQSAVPVEYQRILDQAAFSDAQQASLSEEIAISHCNLLDDESAQVMVRGQRLRDAVIASSLLAIDRPVTVMIAGLGHVRNDRGLPYYMARNLDRPRQILSIGLLQVDPDKTTPGEYAEYFNVETLPFDIVIFTPAVDIGDPCAGLEQRFKKQHDNQNNP